MIKLDGLEYDFDNDKAEEILSLSLDKITYTSSLLRKSLYDFDLETPQGIEKLMALLPIMDPEILKDIMMEIWPGYPTELNARHQRFEIRGFLRDWLKTNEKEGNINTSGPAVDQISTETRRDASDEIKESSDSGKY